MKKTVFIAVCILGVICFSSCRSTSSSCGLADNTTIQTTLKQADLV
ncbi:hypothetical protein [Polaribacter ponticola]|uniref:Uncharacterized protein n=1 Tax=Polaribacter ponticola TaxID=2978475 RepID=A0ABT5SCY8_9FLAO|nr:hypothetical protein [Polaribacter sp. MSW5]MDD7916003.1 hypothetical protein [Polaribacter sp. MSW5]